MPFSVDNLPYGVARRPEQDVPQCVTRLGDTVIFLVALHDEGLFNQIAGLPKGIFEKVIAAHARTFEGRVFLRQTRAYYIIYSQH